MINVNLIKVSKLSIVFDNNIRIYLPIHNDLNVLVNSSQGKIEEGNFFLLNAYQLALIYPDFEQVDNLVFEVILNSDFIDNSSNNIMFFNNFLRSINSEDKISIIKVIDAIRKNNLTEKEIEGFLEKTFNYLRTKELSIDRDRPPIDNEINIIAKYYDYIRKDSKNINTNLTELAGLYKTSSAYFSKTFKRVSGFNLSEFKQLYKLRLASDLLLESSNSLDEIANIIGYQSTKSLYDVFNNTIDILPYEYKNVILKSDSKVVKDTSQSNTYIKHKDKLKGLDYSNLYDKKSSYVEHEINLNHRLDKFRFNGINIYDLSRIGEDYLNNLIKINKDIGINYVLLDVYLDFELEDLIFLKNSKIYMTKNEFLILLELLNNNKIQVGLSIEIRNRDFNLYGEKDYKQIESFQKFILDHIPYEFRINYEWIIILTDFFNLENIHEYIKKRTNLLKNTFGPNVRLSTFLGKINSSDLNKLENLIAKLDLNSIFNQIYFNFVYNLELNTTTKDDKRHEYNVLSYNFKSVLKDIDKTRDYMNITIAHFIIEIDECNNNLFSDNSYIYSDLIINYIYADNISYIQDHIMYFVLVDKKTKQKYKPTLMRDRYLKTSTYFLLEHLSKIKGQIIKNDRGVTAIKDENNINLMIMNNLCLDYIFADEKNYKDLEKNKRKLKLNIYPVYGKYKVSKNIINSYYANPLRRLNDFNTGGILSKEDRDYINSVNHPYRLVDLISITHSYQFELELEAFSIVYVQMHRM